MLKTTKRPGRPKGSGKPKPPREPLPMGRRSNWAGELQPTGMLTRRVPLVLADALDDPDFLLSFTNLLLDFSKRKTAGGN